MGETPRWCDLVWSSFIQLRGRAVRRAEGVGLHEREEENERDRQRSYGVSQSIFIA